MKKKGFIELNGETKSCHRVKVNHAGMEGKFEFNKHKLHVADATGGGTTGSCGAKRGGNGREGEKGIKPRRNCQSEKIRQTSIAIQSR